MIVRECGEKIANKIVLFPNLLNEILNVVREMLRTRLPITNQVVHNIFESQLAYVNFKHPNFVEAYNQLVSPNGVTNGTTAIDEESNDGSEYEQNGDSQCVAVKELIESYVNGVREQLKDLIPKIIVKFLINSLKENLQDELVEQLNRSELLEDLLCEEKFIPLKRKEADEMLVALSKAQRIIGEIDHHRI